MHKLIELAGRCEQATGPDRELDIDIQLGIGGSVEAPAGCTIPFYTASLDAAMTLVPEGWTWDVDATVPEMGIDWTLHEPVPDGRSVKGTSGLPALAFCAAALRSRSIEGE